MANYIDGFAFPISINNVEAYKKVAEAVAAIWIEHGAVDYREFIADDLHREGCASFVDTFETKSDETVIFGWIEFDSRESRDSINQSIESDSRMVDLVAPLLEPGRPIFKPTKMAYGGFKPLVGRTDASDG